MQFPFHNYTLDVKKEVEEDDLQVLEACANLPLNGVYNTNISEDGIQKMDTPLKNAEDIKECLKLNQTLQQKIILSLNKLVTSFDKNKAKMEEALQLRRSEEKIKKIGKTTMMKPISLFSAPYFRDLRGMVPPYNEDTIAKLKNQDITAYLRPPRPWSLEEKDQLMHGVAASCLSHILKPFKAKRDFLKSKIKDTNTLESEIPALKKQVAQLEKEMKLHCARSYKELIAEAKDHIDWMTISATNMEGLRSEQECELMWNNYLSIFVNKSPFTKEEDSDLKSLAMKYSERNWVAIAEELKTNRTAIQCFERYHTKLNAHRLKKYFTPEEDQKLLEVIEAYRIGEFIPWNIVCSKMEGRARHQIINRYERTISNKIKRGPWSHEEDAMLLACTGKFGYHWTKMVEFFPGRTVYNIRERYVSCLDPDLKIGNWSQSEDIELIRLIKEHGYGKWGQISRSLPGRTDNMCLCRAKRIIIRSLSKTKAGEIDFQFDNVDKLVKFMKPVAPSKNCTYQNKRLQEKQNKALDTLKAGLEKIAPLIDEIIDLECLEFSSLSLNTLRLLQKEFSASENQEDAAKMDWKPKYIPENCNLRTKRDIFSRRKSNGKNAEDTEEEYSEDDDADLRLSYTEKIWLQNVINEKFKEEANVAFNNNSKKKKCINLSGKESMECTLYQSFLQKELLCKKFLDEAEYDFTLGSVDYNKSLALVTHLFVQPPSTNNFVVAPPNFSTMHGLSMILACENRLRRTANFVDHSMPYVRYVTGFSETLPKCVSCTLRDGAAPLQDTFDGVVKKMKSSLLIVDDVMKTETMIETRELFSDMPCKCDALINSKKEHDLAAKRFLSMFLWPMLMHLIGLSEKQEELVYKRNPVIFTHKGRKCKQGRSPKRTVELISQDGSVSQEQNRGKKRKVRRPSMKQVKKTANYSPVKKAKLDETLVEQEDEPDTSSIDIVPTRRSSRGCVLSRKSFSYQSENCDLSS